LNTGLSGEFECASGCASIRGFDRKSAFLKFSLAIFLIAKYSDFMPAPYTRGWKTTGGRGHQAVVDCGFCGRKVPRHKTFTEFRGFRITDPLLRRMIARQDISTFEQKMYVCPSCARHRGIVVKRDITGRKFRVQKRRRTGF